VVDTDKIHKCCPVVRAPHEFPENFDLAQRPGEEPNYSAHGRSGEAREATSINAGLLRR